MIETETREFEQFLRDHGYSEDIIKESIAAVREKFPDVEPPTGPDTTENIKEVVNDLEMPDQGFELIDSNEELPDINPGNRRYIDINGNVSDEPSYLSMPKDVADRIAYEHGYHRTPREAADEEVSRWKARERLIPKKGTKGMKTVYPSIFDNILEQMSDLHARKNSDYGDAAYEGYKEFGITYYIIQLHNKLNRLKSLTKDASKPQVNESLEDTLIDLAVYSVMALEALKRDD